MGCGRSIPATYYACPYCGKPAGAGMQTAPKQTAYPIVAGVFEILAGIIGMAQGGLIAISGGYILGIPYLGYYFDFFWFFVICGAVLIVFGLLALLGGIFAIQRKNYGLALVGAIFSLFVGYIIFGILALVFVILAKDEFH